MVKARLFRDEAVARQRTQWLGTVIIAPRTMHRAFTALAVFCMLGLGLLLALGTYTKKARVQGWLVPEQGLVRVFAPEAGVVEELFVREGALVKEGEKVLSLSFELHTATLGGTQERVLEQLRSQRDSLVRHRQQLEGMRRQQLLALADQTSLLAAERAELRAEIEIQRKRVELSQLTASRREEMAARGFISEQEAQNAKEQALAQRASLRTLTRQSLAVARAQRQLDSERSDLPFTLQAELAELDGRITHITQQVAVTESRRKIIITAPAGGTVTAVQVDVGSRASTTIALLGIIPRGSRLQAELFSRGEFVGFVRVGQKVLIRYGAFPYQKFGHYAGEVASISRTALSPGDLPVRLAGLTELLPAGEPLYRITVVLRRQSVRVRGEDLPLQVGMRLQADVVIETRKLYEWMLLPIFSLSERVGT